MHLRLGLMTTIVVCSPQAAEQFLKTHDLIFASRPPLQATKYMSYQQKNFAMAPYGSYWTKIRKICTQNLLSNAKINYFQPTRKEELDLLIEYFKEAARAPCVVDISAKLSALSVNMTCRMVLGKKRSDDEFDERGFETVIREGFELVGKPNLGLTKRSKAVAKVFDSFMEKIIDEHVQSKDENRTEDFVDVMLSFEGSEDTENKIERDHIKAVVLLLPFSSGRRGCPGIQLALTVVKQVTAQLVHCFDWELPEGMLPTELDMTEEFGLVTPRAKHLLAVPSYRLRT
ncbi:hypothetical protein CUMW_280190 [Citrus unshiu]|uniref:Cytochrome P450 n=1 Tax=Citrus unshiu TaxID=55188 RepID=A0A2H5NAF4_CITUN|nr:hypothetical protein CUMW_280190 [Citrus unshiu]